MCVRSYLATAGFGFLPRLVPPHPQPLVSHQALGLEPPREGAAAPPSPHGRGSHFAQSSRRQAETWGAFFMILIQISC